MVLIHNMHSDEQQLQIQTNEEPEAYAVSTIDNRPGIEMTPKVPPQFDGQSSRFEYEVLIDDWLGVTTLDADKHGSGTDVRPGVPRVSASFTWRALLAAFAGRRGTMCAAKGSDVCPAVPWVSASFVWQAWDNVHCRRLLRGRRGTMCTAKGSDARPGVRWVSASCAWPAWDNVHCWRLLRGRRGTMCTAKGSDLRPGVP